MLVIDAEPETAGLIRRLAGGACPVHHATSLDAAVSELDQRETAVIVADMAGLDGESLAAFKALKRRRPEILVIVLTDASDSELVIELINQAQIFRYINRPATPELLKRHIHAALTRYQAFRQNPHLTRQHEVAAAGENGSLGGRLLARVKSLRGWL